MRGLCIICNKPTKYLNLSLGYSKYCSRKCIANDPNRKNKFSQTIKNRTDEQRKIIDLKRKQTNLERYGDKNYHNIEKIKQTKKEKYGDENYNNSTQASKTKINWSDERKNEVKTKRIKTTIEKYDAENVYASEYGKTKIKETMNKKYGVDYATQNKEILEKVLNTNRKNHDGQLSWNTEQTKQTNIERYGKEYYTQTSEFQEKATKTYQEKYGVSHPSKLKENRDQSWQTRHKNNDLDKELDNPDE